MDVIVGSSTTPNSLAMRRSRWIRSTPISRWRRRPAIINPMDPKTRWVFKTPQNDALMADAVAVSMKANGVKTLGYIGFADAYGDGWLAEIQRSAQTAGIKVVAEEKYNRNDPSVTGQVLKLYRGQSGCSADRRRRARPAPRLRKELVARNYKGKIYQTHGVANPDFLRVVGKDGNGQILPAGPMLVYEQLPDSNEDEEDGRRYVTRYETEVRQRTRTTFGGHTLRCVHPAFRKRFPKR